MEQARDSALPAATARVMLSREKDERAEPGFLIYAPVYENDRTPKTVEERRAALSGFVYSQFRAADFIAAIMAIKGYSDIDLQLYDGPHPTSANLFHDTASHVAQSAPSRFTTSNQVDVAGRPDGRMLLVPSL